MTRNKIEEQCSRQKQGRKTRCSSEFGVRGRSSANSLSSRSSNINITTQKLPLHLINPPTAAMKPANPSFVCANCVRTLKQSNISQTTSIVRTFSSKTPARGTTSSSSEHSPRLYHDQPRWKQTPAAMKMPIRLRPQPKQPVWNVNSNEERLNHAYDLFLGKDGSAMLDDETKVSLSLPIPQIPFLF